MKRPPICGSIGYRLIRYLDESCIFILNYDFGTVALGAPDPIFNFDIFNLEETAGFTASLDLVSFVGSGDTGVLSTDLTTFADLESGLSNGFAATFDTSTPGAFSVLYTIELLDEDIAGGTNLSDLSLLLTGEIVAATEDANFDQDFDVDGDDFLIWQRGFNRGTTQNQGDGNNSGTVDVADLAIWKQQFGATSLTSVAMAIPEPGTPWLWTIGMVFFGRRRVSRSRSARELPDTLRG